MQVYNLITLIVVLTAAFGYINFRFLKLPSTIGIMILSLVTSFIFIVIGKNSPAFANETKNIISSIKFDKALMNVMVSFLLFSGAIQIKHERLREQRTAIITFSTIGTLISTVLVAVLLYSATTLVNMPIDFIHCLLFGALISPTDPIAVLGILKKANIPSTLEMKITGESLFNDGVGVVIFLTVLEIINVGSQSVTVAQVAWLFTKEAVGGILFGWLLGNIAFVALRSVDRYILEVAITLAVVMGGYSLANYLQVSGLLAMVVAGIITGNKSRNTGMSDISRDYLDKFWEMIDEFFNAILFLLIGFQMLLVQYNLTIFWLSCIAIVIVLIARWISVGLPILILNRTNTFEKNAIAILTWGGLRGGLSVALALSLPKNNQNEIFVSITYSIVLFSIVVQGLTIGKVAKKLT